MLRPRTFWILMGLALLLRVFFAVALPGNVDQEAWDISAAISEHNGNVYAETSRYNYAPVWFITISTANKAAANIGIPFSALLRSFLSIMDIGNALLIGAIANRLRPGSGYAAALVYGFNPGAILVVGFHGQFETQAFFPALLAICLAIRYDWRGNAPHLPAPAFRHAVLLWLCVTFALLIKHNTAFVLFPLFVWLWGYRRAILAMLFSALVFVLSFLPYVPEGSSGILRYVFLYRSIIEPYGLLVLQLPYVVGNGLMMLAVFITPGLVRHRPLDEALLMAALVWLVFTVGIGINYFLLPMLLGSIHGTRHLRWLMILGLVVAYVEFNMMIPRGALTVPLLRVAWASLWLICALWLFKLITNKSPLRYKVVPAVSKRAY